jgi:hypothetical protein
MRQQSASLSLFCRNNYHPIRALVLLAADRPRLGIESLNFAPPSSGDRTYKKAAAQA